MYGIPGHGKGEVDHVGGTAKVTIRKMAAHGHSFYNASNIVEALVDRYAGSSSVKYYIKEISPEQLETARNDAQSLKLCPIDGSSYFRAMVFTPGEATFKASPRLYICQECKEMYGSCSIFSKYSLLSMRYDQPFMRSQLNANEQEEGSGHCEDNENDNDDDNDECELWDFLTAGSVVAVANEKASQDSVWFIKITDNNCVEKEIVFDLYHNSIIPEDRFLKGHFLERSDIGKDYTLFKVSKLETYFYRETILYPFVPLQESKKG